MKGTIAGIKDYDNAQTISVYPNPASDVLYVQTERAGVIELLDMNGRILKKEKINAGIQRVDVSGFSDGIYLLNMQSEKTEFFSVEKKIIIAR